jgi:hypothetical protein
LIQTLTDHSVRDLARLVVVVLEAPAALLVVDLIPLGAVLEAVTTIAETIEGHVAP